jgi:signal transduction histidine kinase
MQQIIAEWETFAETLGPVADKMSALALRDHAKEILETIAVDITTAQDLEGQRQKSKGNADSADSDSPAAVHGWLRHASNFSVVQLSAEYRALRSTVLRLWLSRMTTLSPDAADEMVRFNEAIDQALAESLVTFTARADKTRDLFLAVLGHDLRAPLATMGAAGAVLTHPKATQGGVAEMGASVVRATGMMNRMVEDLVSYTRTQMGGAIPVSLKFLDARKSCEIAVEDARSAYPGSRFDMVSSGDLQGRFDEVRLHQLLTNLLLNAAQYGEKGSPVSLESRVERDTIVIGVNNRGDVIPEESWSSIFDLLVQLPEEYGDDVRPRTSMGLGLFIAREIAEAHGGDISVASDADSGTTFTVRLPRTPVIGERQALQ